METLNRLVEIFKEIIPDSEYDMEKITMDTKIQEDLGLNSIGIMYLVMAIEQEFDCTLHNASIETFRTIGDVVRYIEANS